MRTRCLWPGIVVISTSAVVAVVATGAGSPWRVVFALWFVLICPGASLVRVFGLREPTAELAVIVPLSLSLVTLTSAVLFYGHLWSFDREFGLLAGMCLVGLLWSQLAARNDIKGES